MSPPCNPVKHVYTGSYGPVPRALVLGLVEPRCMTDPRSDEPRSEVEALPGPGGMAPRELIPASVLPPVKCKAHTSKGVQCKRWAIVGGFVCPFHGGGAPQVRRAANERLLALAPRAVQVMAHLLEHAESEPVRLKAATELLDRGIGKAVNVSLDITPQEASEGPSPLDLAIARALEARGLPSGDQVVELEPGEDGVYEASDLGERALDEA